MFWGSDWPKRQVLNDLWALGQASLARAPFLLRLEDCGQADLAAQLREVSQTKEMRLETGDSYLAVLAYLNRLAFDGEPADAAFALAVLLADAVHGQVGPEGEYFGWLVWRKRLDDMPRAWAATLARGFAMALDVHDIDAAPRPTKQMFLSEDKAAIIAPLVALARRLEGAMIDAVASADYGYRADEHATALLAVLADEACKFPAGERWFPAEVVELTGHDPTNGATFLPCICLLILDDLHNAGSFDQMSYRWMNNADLFLGALEAFRNPILRGIRHVMEQDFPDNWDPYFEWKPSKIETLARFVPWFVE